MLSITQGSPEKEQFMSPQLFLKHKIITKKKVWFYLKYSYYKSQCTREHSREDK